MTIPYLPGVPPLRETLKRGLISTGLVLLRDAFITPANQVWGIFDKDNKKVLLPDSFLGIDYQKDYRISDFPLEDGSFSSYNKVAAPYSATVTFAQGGSSLERSTFMAQVEKIAADLNLYTIITPEQSFTNANIERHGYERRAESGANLLIVRIAFREIRNTPAIQYSQTKSGSQISSSVPNDEKTQSSTSTGLSSTNETKQPSSQATSNNGAVSALEQSASADAGNMMSVDVIQ